MGEQLQTRPVGWGRTARYGAEAGITLALIYAILFISYAAVRSGLTLLATPDVDAGLLPTVIATWLALALPALALVLIAALPAAAIGALTALVLRGVLSNLATARTAGRGVAVGATICLGLSLGLLGLVLNRMEGAWTAAVVETLAFWLLLPMVLYTVAGGVAGGRMARLLGPAPRRHPGGRQSPSASRG
jgi:hypothetical protein